MMTMRPGTRTLVMIAVLTGVAATWTGKAQAEPASCRREIARASAKLADKRIAALQKCRDAVLTGKIAGPCPDAKAGTAIAKATAKFQSAIAKRCGGADHNCATTGDNDALSTIGWDLGTCPGLDGACGNALATCGDVATCLQCVNGVATDQMIGLAYDDLASTSDAVVKKCQRAIGRETAKAFRTARKALAKCEDLRAKGTVSSCPDAKAAEAIAKADAKRAAKICTACGGADKVCGGGDDLAAATIGLPSDCPSVSPPGASTCEAPIGTLGAMVTCVDCVNGHTSVCSDYAGVPAMQSYPAECGGDAPAVCGNGTLEGTEECDGAADAMCPGFCLSDCTCGAFCGDGTVDPGEQC